MSKADNWQTLKEEIRQTAKSQADVVWMVSESLLGEGYQLGEEAFGLRIGGPSGPTIDPNDHDCSGHIWSVYYLASEWSHEFGFGYILWKDGAKHPPRLTAHDYSKLAVKIGRVGRDVSRALTGDVVCFRNILGHVTHITLVGRVKNGVRMSQEARGERYGVVQYPLQDVLNRSLGAAIYRFPWLSLGEALPQPAPDVVLKIAWWQRGRPEWYTRNPYVTWWQRRLNDLFPGLEPLDVDGVYGPYTEERQKLFEYRYGLPVDGQVTTPDWLRGLNG